MWQVFDFSREITKIWDFITFGASKRGAKETRFSLACLKNAGFYSIWELCVRNLVGESYISKQRFPEMPCSRVLFSCVEKKTPNCHTILEGLTFIHIYIYIYRYRYIDIDIVLSCALSATNELTGNVTKSPLSHTLTHSFTNLHTYTHLHTLTHSYTHTHTYTHLHTITHNYTLTQQKDKKQRKHVRKSSNLKLRKGGKV